MSEGFFSRWSKRKMDDREAKPVEAEPMAGCPSVTPPYADSGADVGRGQDPAATDPPPTLEDVQSLTPESDFTRFVRPGVSPDVKNAALKKLFSDPHFNVMDRLDTYIDDYNTPDPIPPEMLRQLASAKFLKLFDEEEKEEGREVADDPAPQSVAQSATGESAVTPPDENADTDLRLQQDDAPGPDGPGQGGR